MAEEWNQSQTKLKELDSSWPNTGTKTWGRIRFHIKSLMNKVSNLLRVSAVELSANNIPIQGTVEPELSRQKCEVTG